jgi:uncharacterized protein
MKILIIVILIIFSFCYIQSKTLDDQRPPLNERKFTSPVIESLIKSISGRMKDKEMARIFINAFPNTIDTTVDYDPINKDSFVITGDIDAMYSKILKSRWYL